MLTLNLENHCLSVQQKEMGVKTGRSGGTPGTACSSLLSPSQACAADTKGKEIKVEKSPPLEKKIAESEKEGEKDRAPTYAEISPPIPANTYVGEEGGYAIKS